MTASKPKKIPSKKLTEYRVWIGNDWIDVNAVSPSDAAMAARSRYGRGAEKNRLIPVRVVAGHGVDWRFRASSSRVATEDIS